MTTVVGVHGAGRTHRLREHAAAATGPVWWLPATGAGVAEAVEPEPPAEWVDRDRRDAARFPVFLGARCIRR